MKISTERSGNITTLDPKCIKGQKGPSLSSQGYFYPCCWLDDGNPGRQEIIDLFDLDHLHISNVSGFMEVFESEEWQEFFDILEHTPEFAPETCRIKCAKNSSDKKIHYE